MVFQYTPGQTTPPRFSGGPDTAALANLIRQKNDGLVKGIGVITQALGAMKEKQKKQEQQDFLASMGDRIHKATTIDERHTYDILGDEWGWLGDKQVMETTGDRGDTVGTGGKVVPGNMVTKETQRSGWSRYVEKMNETDFTNTEKQTFYNKLMAKHKRKVIDEGQMHQLLAEGYRLGVDAKEMSEAIEQYGGDSAVGEADLIEGIRDDFKAAGFGDVDFDNPHPLSLEYKFASSPQVKMKILQRELLQRNIWNEEEQAGFMPMMDKILSGGGNNKQIEMELDQLMPRRPTRTMEMSGMLPAPPPAGGSIGVSLEKLKKNMNVLGSGEDLNEIGIQMEFNGDKAVKLKADGTFETPGNKELAPLLNKAMGQMSDMEKAEFLESIHNPGDVIGSAGGGGGGGGSGGGARPVVNPYADPNAPSPTAEPPTPIDAPAPAGEDIVPFDPRRDYVNDAQDAREEASKKRAKQERRANRRAPLQQTGRGKTAATAVERLKRLPGGIYDEFSASGMVPTREELTAATKAMKKSLSSVGDTYLTGKGRGDLLEGTKYILGLVDTEKLPPATYTKEFIELRRKREKKRKEEAKRQAEEARKRSRAKGNWDALRESWRPRHYKTIEDILNGFGSS